MHDAANARPEEVVEHSYNVIFEIIGDGASVATAPSLNDIATSGASLVEDREKAKDLLAHDLRHLQEAGLEIPETDAAAIVTERVQVAVPRCA